MVYAYLMSLFRYILLMYNIILYRYERVMKNRMDYKENLLQNVHEGIEPPTTNGITTKMRGFYHYHHYGCDGHNDKVSPKQYSVSKI
mgnify:CR=1 FL=1